jgi:putative transposase
VPYFHVVFTLPHELSTIVLQNKRLLYDLLFRASAETMLEVARDPKHLGADIGLLSVLHTWGQNLQHHPHIHCIVPAGGLTKDRSGWIAASPRFFLPVYVLSRVFRRKFADGLEQIFDQDKLQFHGSIISLAQPDCFQRFVHKLFRQRWVVYAKPPFGGAEHVLHYLARYTHRVAISNHRLVTFHDDQVSFRWKDYVHGGKQKLMTLPADEFLRRFLLHVLPKGLVRIRHFGLFANRRRTAMLALCRSLLGPPLALTPPLSTQQLCPLCSGPMVLIERLTAYQLDLRSTPTCSKQLRPSDTS